MEKKLFLEINEVSKDFLIDNNVQNFKFLNEIFKSNSIFGKKIQTISEGTKEGLDLDPWVEWVTIHSGKKSKEHKISAIGSARLIKFQMIWEKWEENNISYSLCGVFNSFLRKKSFCDFFIPDPWSREYPKPKYLGFFTLATSFLAKSYSGLNTLFKLPLAIYSFIAFLPIIFSRYKIFFKVILKYLNFSVSFSDCYIIYEYLITILGIYISKKFNSERIILCSNLVAHAQHHFWKIKGKRRSCDLALFLADDLIRTTYEFFDQTHNIYILNGLSQNNVIDLEQLDYLPCNGHRFFLKRLNINYKKIIEGMTHDAKLIFNNNKEKQNALNKLINMKINKEPIFEVHSLEKNSLEYYLKFRKKVSSKTKVFLNGKTLKFSDLFYCIGLRSGSHNPKGFLIIPNKKEDKLNNINIISTDEIFSYFI